jgi:uncharacterized protein (TIGR00269 family)
MRCRVCRGSVVIELARHNAAFCADHFLDHCRKQVERAIHDFEMFSPGDRCLVAVSGGKDSLAVWDLLLELGHDATGFHVGLGIGDYSDESGRHARAFARSRNRELIEVDLESSYGINVSSASAGSGRAPCSACGLSKRHLFDKAALDGGYDVLVTGHNLDDEAAVLYGNVLRWDNRALSRQHPVLPAGNGLPRKVKPLIRLTERETAAYCVLRSLDYQVEECPMAAGNKHLLYKAALGTAEAHSPGTKNAFYFGFLRNAREAFVASQADTGTLVLGSCTRCGATSTSEVCAFCRLVEHSPRATR